MTEEKPGSRADSITIERRGDALALRLQGDVGIHVAGRLHTAAIEAVHSEGDVIAICGEIERCDLSTIQILLALKHELQACGRRFQLSDVSDPLQAMLDLAGLTRVFLARSQPDERLATHRDGGVGLPLSREHSA